MTESERFKSKTQEHPVTGCVLWTAGTNKKGYGEFRASTKRHFLAHRYAWEQVNGPIPEHLQIRHVVCRTPACVNVLHLMLGTAQDDANDRIRDGTVPRGEQSPVTKLTESAVRRMFALREQGWQQWRIGREFGISQPQVSAILNRKEWKHLEIA